LRYPIFYKKLPVSQRDFLFQNFKFYQHLSKRSKKLFDHRVVQFIAQHKFVGNEGLEVTDKMKLLIAGTGIMLSFGFSEYLYSLFNTIIIYPENYYSNLTQTQNKGEANPKFGVVVFSWEDFEAGLAIEDDNIHLGIHEFCHALHFSFKYKRSAEGQEFINNFNALLQYLEDKSVQLHLIDTGYIRDYAFENQYEFLAVLVEHLFETPKKFKQELPVIYKLLIKLMKLKEAVL
jgi:Mlc titration factor MtfA (ptsG expression regulator)